MHLIISRETLHPWYFEVCERAKGKRAKVYLAERKRGPERGARGGFALIISRAPVAFLSGLESVRGGF